MDNECYTCCRMFGVRLLVAITRRANMHGDVAMYCEECARSVLEQEKRDWINLTKAAGKSK